jgi:hypothetical protein
MVGEARNSQIVITAVDKTKSAFDSAKRNLESLRSSGPMIAGAFTPATAAITALSAAIAYIDFRNIVNGIDALNDLKDATGSSIENLSALEDVAERTGTSFESAGTALVKFNNVLKEAKKDSEAAEILKRIGLSAEELKNIDPAEALRRTAVALDAFADDGNKARIVAALFGKSIQEVAPFLHDLAEQQKLVGKVTTEQAAEAEKLNKQFAELEKNSKDFKRALLSEIVPAINESIQRFRDGTKEAKGFWETLIAGNRAIGNEQWKVLSNLFGGTDPDTDIQRIAALKRVLDDTTISQERRLRVEKQLKDLQAKASAVNLPQSDASHDAVEAARLARQGGKPSAPDVPDLAGQKKAAAEALANLKKVVDGHVKSITDGLAASQDALRFNEQYSQALYQQGVQSLQQFYADQDKSRRDNLAAVRQATEAEIAERQKLLNSPLLKGDDKKAERQEVENQIAEARTKLRNAEREADQQAKLSLIERQRAVEQLGDEVHALEARISDLATGKTSAADLLEIANTVREAQRLLQRGGADPQAAQQQADDLGRLLEIQRQVNVAKQSFGELSQRAALSEERAGLEAQRAGDGLLATEDRVREARQKALGDLDALIVKVRELAALNPKDTGLQLWLEELQVQAEKARQAIDPRKLRLDSAADDIGNSIAGGFERAVLQGGKLKDIVRGIGGDVARIFTQEVTTRPLAQEFANFIKGAGGKGTGQNLIGQLVGLNSEPPALTLPKPGQPDFVGPLRPGEGQAAASYGTGVLDGLKRLLGITGSPTAAGIKPPPVFSPQGAQASLDSLRQASDAAAQALQRLAGAQPTAGAPTTGDLARADRALDADQVQRGLDGAGDAADKASSAVGDFGAGTQAATQLLAAFGRESTAAGIALQLLAAASSTSSATSSGGGVGKLFAGLFGGGGAAGGAASSSGGAGGTEATDAALDLFFDDGGYTGNRGTKQVAGVVHGQEYVFSAPAVRRLGAQALDRLHEAARRGRAALPGYEQGGLVGRMPWGAASSAPGAGSRAGAPFSFTANITLGQNVDRKSGEQLAAAFYRQARTAYARGTA